MRQVAFAAAQVAASFMLFAHPATAATAPPLPNASAPPAIASGGRVMLSTHLTPLQSLAASQVATTGRQYITIGKDGTASGGTMYATSVKGDFVVPQNVQAIIDFALGSPMTVSNNFINNGTVYCVSTNSAIKDAALNVRSFLNAQGATLNSALNLSITSKTTVENYGTITADNNLAITAATAIANFGDITSKNGDVTFTGTAPSFQLGSVGHVYALNGNININQTSKARTTLNVEGGGWTARNVNINAPNSDVQFHASDISALVNANARSLEVGVTWGLVGLGNVPQKTTQVSFNTPETVSETHTDFDPHEYTVDTDTD